MRRKEDAIRYGIKPKQQVIGISTEARRNTRSVALAQEKTRQELLNELESTAGKMNVYMVAKQMAKSRQDVVGENCVKDANGKVMVENDQVKEEWRKYVEKLLNEEMHGIIPQPVKKWRDLVN